MRKWQKWLPVLGLVALATAPGAADSASQPPQAPMQSNPGEISLKFPAAGDRGAPDTTTGAGTRGPSCLEIAPGGPSVVALMPGRDNVAKTSTATPTLYWYVPPTTAPSGEFSLADGGGRKVYQTTFRLLPEQGGIVRLSIPPQAALKSGRRYRWDFRLICDPQARLRDIRVRGEIEYVELSSDLNNKLQGKTLLDRAKIYAEEGIWLETLQAAIQLRDQQPAEWKELLQSVCLEVLAEEPLIDCCTPDSD